MTKLEELVEFHEITQLKYRYVRALDTHDWKLMEQCFTEDAHAWFAGGKQTERGRANIVKLLHRLVPSNLVSSHVVMHPELTLTAPTTAKGIWRMQDSVYFQGPNPAFAHGNIQGGEAMFGAGYYHEEYRKEHDGWKISSIGYVRIFEVIERGAIGQGVELSVEPSRGMRT